MWLVWHLHGTKSCLYSWPNMNIHRNTTENFIQSTKVQPVFFSFFSIDIWPVLHIFWMRTHKSNLSSMNTSYANIPLIWHFPYNFHSKIIFHYHYYYIFIIIVIIIDQNFKKIRSSRMQSSTYFWKTFILPPGKL